MDKKATEDGEISSSLERLTADYSTYTSPPISTKDIDSKEKITAENCGTLSTVSGSEEVCCNIFDCEINSDCSIVFEVNNEGQSVVKECRGYHSSCPGDYGPAPGDVLCGVDKVAVIDSYYAESLLDDKRRDVITLRFMRGDSTPKALPNVPIAGAPLRRVQQNDSKRISVGNHSPKKDLEYFRREFFTLAVKAYDKGHYKWSLESACKVLNICKLIPECHHELLSCHDLISKLYDKLGMPSKSLGHLQVAVSVADICSLNVVDIVDLRQRMGKACRQIKDYEVCIGHYNCALEMIQKHIAALKSVGRTAGPAWAAASEALILTYIALGKAYRLQGGQLDMALRSEVEALRHLRSSGCPSDGAFGEVDKQLCRVNICLVLGLQGDLTVENETEMIMAVKDLERGEDAKSLKASSIYRGLSNFFELRRDWDRAIAYRLHEIKIRQSYDCKSATLASALWRVSVYYRNADDDNRAFIYRVKTIEMMTTLFGIESKKVQKYLAAHRKCSEIMRESDVDVFAYSSGSDFADSRDCVRDFVLDSVSDSKDNI